MGSCGSRRTFGLSALLILPVFLDSLLFPKSLLSPPPRPLISHCMGLTRRFSLPKFWVGRGFLQNRCLFYFAPQIVVTHATGPECTSLSPSPPPTTLARAIERPEFSPISAPGPTTRFHVGATCQFFLCLRSPPQPLIAVRTHIELAVFQGVWAFGSVTAHPVGPFPSLPF